MRARQENPLKILMVHCAYEGTGVGDYSEDLRRALVRNNGHIKVETLSAKCFGCEEISGEKKYPCITVADPFVVDTISKIKKLGVLRLLYRGLVYRKHFKQYDIINYQLDYSGFGIIPLLSAGYRSKKPLIVTIHELQETPLEKMLFKLVLPYINKLIVHSSFHKKKLEEQFGHKIKGRIEVIYHGANPDPGPNFDEERKLITYIGHLGKRKGFHYLMDALLILKERGREVKVDVFGFYSQKDNDLAMNYMRENGLLENVAFHGMVNTESLYRIIRESRFTIAPYLKSYASGVILKSMSCATPVITTTAGSIPEYTEDGGALLVPPADSQQLAAAIMKLDEDDELRSDIGRAGWENVKKRFDWELIARDYTSLFLHVCSSSPVH